MYVASVKSVPLQLAQFFVGVHARKQKEVVAVRFDKTCDDNASDQTFGILESRLQKVPLYELRFFSGDHFTRLFAFAYVDGGFRFIIPPDEERLVSNAARLNSADKGQGTPSESAEKQLERVRRGGTVQAARLTHRVTPEYPPLARAEHLQGTVRLHAIIGRDGAIQELRVMKGACSLAKAAVEAVRQWRYSPTLLEGRPVEVDTTIDVIFALRY
jgi:TonB family protein